MILDRIFGLEERSSMVVTGAGVGQDATLNRIFGDNGKTSSGVVVTEDTGQTLSAVYRAVTLISSTIASLPLLVYRRMDEEGNKEPARTHPAFMALRRPNPEMTSFFYRQAAMAYVLLYGKHYTFIERDGKGQVAGLWPMRTPDVSRNRVNGSMAYDVHRVTDNSLFPKPPFGSRPVLLGNEVLELTTFDGESIISHAREQLGEALAAQSFGGGFYAGGAQPYMVFTSPTAIKDPVRFRENWEKVHGGSKRKIAVLENMDVKTIGMPLNDAQFLESRQFYVTEISRWFGVPPHKLMDLTRATFSNIEEQQLEWYEGLLPWLEMIEQEGERQLLMERDADQYFLEHNVDGMLRGNIQARYAAYATGIQWGFLNRNQVRRRENLNTMGEEGDVYLVPGNMTTADKAGELLKQPTPPPPSEPDEEDKPVDSKFKDAARTTLLQAVERMRDKEAGTIRKAAMRSEAFLSWLDEYRKHWPIKWADGLIPAMKAVSSLGLAVDSSVALWEDRCTVAADALLDLTGHVTPKELADRVAAEVAAWPSSDEIVDSLLKGELI